MRMAGRPVVVWSAQLLDDPIFNGVRASAKQQNKY